MRRYYLVVTVFAVVAMLLVAAPASASPASHAGGSGCEQFYTIRRGDTLYRIATRFGTSTWALANLNGIHNPNRIYAGQTICVRAGHGWHDGDHHHGGKPGWFKYTIRRGDTLFSIARWYGTSVAELARINHIWNPDRIYAGQVILIPRR